MSRSQVAWLLAFYFGAVLVGVVFQIDRFPLSWVPMYSNYTPKSAPSRPTATDRGAEAGQVPKTEPPKERRVKVRDTAEAAKGFFATHRDGSQSRIGMRELNIARRNMWRLYYQRIFRKDPPKFKQANQSLDELSRWARGLEEGEPVFSADWPRRLFRSVNATLGLRPEDPHFVVRLEAFQEYRYYGPDYELRRTKTRHADIRWNEEWAEDFAE
jgi:hypothetical protein